MYQGKYIERKLKEFRLQDSKPSKIPVDPGYLKGQEMCEPFDNKEIYRQAIGSLQYLASNSRPDIAVSISILARRVSDPRKPDWTEDKLIFCYLNGTKYVKLKLGDKNDWKQQQLIAYTDADWSGDSENRKSNTGFLFKYYGAPIS